MNRLLAWLHVHWGFALAGSLVFTAAIFLALPWWLRQLPADYFSRVSRRRVARGRIRDSVQRPFVVPASAGKDRLKAVQQTPSSLAVRRIADAPVARRPGGPLHLAAILLKNAVGGVLVLGGLVLLLTPGPGIPGILIGLTLMNFPGKFRLERWLVSRRGVWEGVNWLRRRWGAPPFERPAAGP
jgi:hypothetical protein